jgi:hypothetical protein
MTGPWIAAFLVLWAAVLVLAVLVLGLLRRIGPVLERAERAIRMSDALAHVDGLPPGAAVPEFDVVDPTGRRLPFADAGSGDRVVLFVDADCPACSGLADALAAEPGIAQLPIVVVTGRATSVSHYARLVAAGLPVFGQPDGAASAAFQQHASPYAVAVSANHTVVASLIPGDPADLMKLADALDAHRTGNHHDTTTRSRQ